ncbi:helix-turn-helix domain-containing protein [Proteinivorax hydrogeniformans]|uniref:Helix-turn-helix domain-containing protein n=1 Tax=Proteinivorax hydrogeniformans TaxID=1826727 RepID=A0AAU8HQQ9_9FIRM
MSSKTKYNAEEKYLIIEEYLSGSSNKSMVAYKYGLNRGTIFDWLDKFEKHGLDGLVDCKTRASYSKNLKENAIKDYLTGQYTLRHVTEKYGISDHSVLRKWIKKYNGHRKSDAKKGMSYSMTKRKTFNLEDKIEIVQSCIDNNHDYKFTAETYSVSYQQVYQWVKKYESGGEQKLKDRRGRKKSKDELTPEEKAQHEIKRIQEENEKLRAENALLKKLKELERGNY